MKHIVRIAPAMLIACFAGTILRRELGFESEFMSRGPEGLFDLGLLIAVMLLVSLVDREYFWAIPPKQERVKWRRRATR